MTASRSDPPSSLQITSSTSLPPLLLTSPDYDFAHYTTTQRWPATITNVINDNADWLTASQQDALRGLASSVQSSKKSLPSSDTLRTTESDATDIDDWQSLSQLGNCTWHSAPWYAAEAYLYRLILQYTDYYTPYSTGHRRDPFHSQKMKELRNESTWQMIDSALLLQQTYAEQYSSGQPGADTSTQPISKVSEYLLEYCVWGNRVDLSYQTLSDSSDSRLDGIHGLEHALNEERAKLLANDTQQLMQWLKQQQRPGHVAIIHDNSGAELLTDLVLIYHLLSSGIASKVTCHCKAAPTFVSDATPDDIQLHIQQMVEHAQSQHIQKAGQYLQAAVTSKQINIQPHIFWNSLHFFDELPADVHTAFFHTDLTISKGDANMRRFVLDRLWQPDTPVSSPQLTPIHNFPSSLLLLRTNKSDTIVGLPAGLAQKLDAEEQVESGKSAKWRVNGKYGVILFSQK